MQALRVFYLDDEPDLLELFVDLFTESGVEITTFSEPSRLMESIRKSSPDLVFLDYRLPRITGDQVALQLDRGLPRALITGDVMVQLEADFDAVFPKPLPISEIREFIRSHARKKSGT